MAEQTTPPAQNQQGPATSFDAVIASKITSDTTVSWNIDQNVIVTTEDKLWRRITEHLSSIEARKGWIAPISIFATLVAVLCTASFNDTFFLKAAVWHSIFVLAAVAVGIWLVQAIYKAKKSRKIEDLVEAIKKSGQTHKATLSLDSKTSTDQPKS